MARKTQPPATQNDSDFAGDPPKVAGGAKEPVFFFKIILPPILEDHKLGIPNKFARDFSNDLSSTAELVVPANQSWTVKISSEGSKFWFCDGLNEFFKFYSVSCGYFLVFDYRGNSIFGVRIFDLTACEISYPSNSASHQSSELLTDSDDNDELLTDSDDNDEDDANCDFYDDDDDVAMLDDPPVESNRVDFIDLSSDDEPIRARTRPCTRKIKEEFDEEVKNVETVDSEHGESKASFLAPKSSFKAVMMDHLDKPFLEIPSDIGRKYPRGGSGEVKLEVSDGRTWIVKGNFFRGRLKSLGKGWAEFVRDNKLKSHHTCVFELVDFDNEFRLKVSGWTGFRTSLRHDDLHY